MTVPARGFTDLEFAGRLAKIQAAMTRHDVSALLLTSEAEIRYVTGFMTQFWQSPTRPWFVIVPAAGKPIAVIPTIGAALMRDCYIGDLRCWSSPAADDDGISLLASALNDCLGARHRDTRRLGLLRGRETALRMPLAGFDALMTQLGPVSVVDMTADIQHIRMIKSPAEQNKLRHICRIASTVFDDMPQWVSSGLPLDMLFRQFKIRALDAGVDDVSYLVGAAGPGGYADIIAPPTARPLAIGDVLMLDTGCIWDGCFCDFDRNFAIGHATDAAMVAHHRLYDAVDAALAMLRPGIMAADLFTAMHHALYPNRDAATTGDDVGRYGHGLGIQLTEPPSHTSWDKTVLKSGMALTLEPSISYGDGLIMVAEENLLVTEDGFTLLSTRAPRDLPVITPHRA